MDVHKCFSHQTSIFQTVRVDNVSVFFTTSTPPFHHRHAPVTQQPTNRVHLYHGSNEGYYGHPVSSNPAVIGLFIDLGARLDP